MISQQNDIVFQNQSQFKNSDYQITNQHQNNLNIQNSQNQLFNYGNKLTQIIQTQRKKQPREQEQPFQIKNNPDYACTKQSDNLQIEDKSQYKQSIQFQNNNRLNNQQKSNHEQKDNINNQDNYNIQIINQQYPKQCLIQQYPKLINENYPLNIQMIDKEQKDSQIHSCNQQNKDQQYDAYQAQKYNDNYVSTNDTNNYQNIIQVSSKKCQTSKLSNQENQQKQKTQIQFITQKTEQIISKFDDGITRKQIIKLISNHYQQKYKNHERNKQKILQNIKKRVSTIINVLTAQNKIQKIKVNNQNKYIKSKNFFPQDQNQSNVKLNKTTRLAMKIQNYINQSKTFQSSSQIAKDLFNQFMQEQKSKIDSKRQIPFISFRKRVSQILNSLSAANLIIKQGLKYGKIIKPIIQYNIPVYPALKTKNIILPIKKQSQNQIKQILNKKKTDQPNKQIKNYLQLMI